MKTLILALFITSILFVGLTGCTPTNNGQESAMKRQLDSLTKVNDALVKVNKVLKDTIDFFRYPAADRLNNIQMLIASDKFGEARKEIVTLKRLFPTSESTTKAELLVEEIDKKEIAYKAEEERIKALGFKALKEESAVQIDYNKVAAGAFSIAQTFTYDAYNDSYMYNTADRGNKFISARITITSSDKDPLLPQFWAYTIDGDKLYLIGNFHLKFARWEDYGTYLGNYTDNSNDFSKSATIPFKIGLEVEESVLQKPIMILLGKTNCLSRSTDRFENPPVSYSGNCTESKTLSIEDVKKGYFVIKILNKNKL